MFLLQLGLDGLLGKYLQQGMLFWLGLIALVGIVTFAWRLKVSLMVTPLAAALQAGLSVWAVRRWVGYPNALDTPGRVIGFLALGGPLGCLINASLSVPVLVMSADSRPERVAQARESGVHGWVSKSAQPDVIISAVTTVIEGGRSFPGMVYDTSPLPHVRALAAEPEVLSDLQRQILQMLGNDIPNKAIARQLGLSETEVRVQVSWLTEMLQASSRREAYARALERGVLTP